MVVLSAVFVVAAVMDAVNGDKLSFKLNMLWAVVCIVQGRIDLLVDSHEHLNTTIGKIVELLGLMVGAGHGK